jgi:hypothetical protein
MDSISGNCAARRVSLGSSADTLQLWMPTYLAVGSLTRLSVVWKACCFVGMKKTVSAGLARQNIREESTSKSRFTHDWNFQNGRQE